MRPAQADTWRHIMDILAAKAPRTAACVRAPASAGQVAEAQAVIGVEFPEDLMGWWRLADGVRRDAVDGRLLPPQFLPLGVQATVDTWQLAVSTSGPGVGSAVDPDRMGAGRAGTGCRGFDERLVPIAEDTSGDLLVVDLRPGTGCGGVLVWWMSDGTTGVPVWGSVAEMWPDIAEALAYGRPESGHHDGPDPHLTRNGCAAVFTAASTLCWES